MNDLATAPSPRLETAPALPSGAAAPAPVPTRGDMPHGDAPGATAAGDPLRAVVLRAAADALRQVAPALEGPAATLLPFLYAAVPTGELTALAPEAMAAAAASLCDLAATRQPAEARLRVLPPGPGPGQGGAHAVVEIVTDDMPFLVDSVLGALSRHGRTVRQLLHPVLAVRRDAAGRLVGLGAAAVPGAGGASAVPGVGGVPGAGGTIVVSGDSNASAAPGAGGAGATSGGDGAPESMMRIELAVSGARGPATTGLEEALGTALADVRIAVVDHGATLAMLHHAAAEVPAGPPAEFLRWLAADTFVLLGHRRLDIAADGGVRVRAAENLGLLRQADLPVFDALRDLSGLPAPIRAALADLSPVTIAKANMRSTVHRPQHADVVATRILAADGRVCGVRLFLGLFAAEAYNRNPRSIPLLAQRCERILAAAGVDPDAHDGRALRNILDTWPRDELFQAPEAEILAGARRALDLAIRPRPALVVRRDPFGRFVSCIVWLPRDSFDTRLRERVGRLLTQTFEGRLSAFHIALGDGALARVHYILGTDPARPSRVDPDALERAITQAARSFSERLAEALGATHGEVEAARLLGRWRDAFPEAYRAGWTAGQGAADLALAETALATGRPAAVLTRPPGAAGLVLRMATAGAALPLSDILPLFESLDLRALEELPYRLTPGGADPVVLQAFMLEPRGGAAVDPARHAPLLAALAALLDGRAEADGFNRLVLRAGLDWRECWLLRALFRWLRQVGFGFEGASVEAALVAHPDAARLLVDLFHARFDPGFAGDRGAREAVLDGTWAMLLDQVANPDEDRILARLRRVLDAVLRTNFHQDRPWLSLKIDSAAAGDMPAPRPWREIWVHSPRTEAVHLRAGPVARGGIRWSDRREDFRTEVLGLMKAQRVKNVVIVPNGAKGGFVLKRPPPSSDREAFAAEGVACYRILVDGMLDITDTLDGDQVVPPARCVRRDGDDPYLVVAADKGTATFSDIANGMAVARGFWLGDAFASGGSAGYDHKGMGITARGAWVMIARHFAELGRDIQAEPFTCVGVGDMSGDVFGNGLLVSRQTRLLAAFDHRHIFVDPDPDPAVSYAERERLFRLPRSSWAEYDPALISSGGGVFPRSAKTISLPAASRALLGVAEERAEPATILRAILRLPADLLYFGGIGTYVKSSAEAHAQAGDRANDALRVDGREIRARVVGEGANLAVTQAGRVEIARAGGRLNTDALDNAAGVSTSDHEVNIKILLADVERGGGLTRSQRDTLLAEMTEEVAALVLRDNALQSLAVSLEERAGAAALPAQAALMRRLEAEGVLDRAVAGLPDAAALAARQSAGDALTRPEIAALLPLAKLWLADRLEASALPDEPAFAPLLGAYFPTPLRERYPEAIARHRLRRELVATALSNMVANRLGVAGLARLAADADPLPVVRAVWLAGALLGLEAAFDAIDAAPAPAAARFDALATLARLWEGAAAGLLAGADPGGALGDALKALGPGAAALLARETAADTATAAAWRGAGLPAAGAALAAAAPRLLDAPAILRLAATAGASPEAAASAWAQAGADHGLDGLRDALATTPLPGAFGPRARAALLADLAATQTRLAAAGLRGEAPAAAAAAGVAQLSREAAAAGDLAALTVAARAAAALAR